MNIAECDNCRRRGDALPVGWLVLAAIEPPRPAYMSALLAPTVPDITGTFCTWRCVAEYAAARALVAEAEGSGS